MSQVYRVRLGSTVTRTIDSCDEMRHRVELTDILGAEQMKDILRRTLEEDGWSEQEDGTYTKEGTHGEELVWDVDEGSVTARLGETSEVQREVEVVGSSGSTKGAKESAKQSLQAAKQRALEEMKSHEKELTQRVSKKLEESESGRVRDLNHVIQKVYSEALKRKAEEMGTVQEISESEEGDDYELSIRIAN